jgi:peptidase, M23 family
MIKQQKILTLLVFLFGISLGLLINNFIPKPNPKDVTINIKENKTVDSSKVVTKKTIHRQKKVSMEPLSDNTLMKELKKENIQYPKIVLAQAKLETGNYTSKVSKTHNNLFGLRKGNKYRHFKHWSESVKAYKKLIQSRYNGGNYYVFLEKIGYAEDETYVNKLKSFV